MKASLPRHFPFPFLPFTLYPLTMKALTAVERLLQQLFEQPQRLLGPKRLHPNIVTNEVVRAVEQEQLQFGGRWIAPNRIHIALNPVNYQAFVDIMPAFIAGLKHFLEERAVERGIALHGEVDVICVGEVGVRAGSARATASFSEPPRNNLTVPLVSASNRAGYTERIERPVLEPTVGRACIEVLSAGGMVLRAVTLDQPQLTIGRRSTNDIALLDLEVSRQHALIEYIPPGYYVSDAATPATNGTYVNGLRISGRRQLNNGDVIQVGGQRLRFRRPA